MGKSKEGENDIKGRDEGGNDEKKKVCKGGKEIEK